MEEFISIQRGNKSVVNTILKQQNVGTNHEIIYGSHMVFHALTFAWSRESCLYTIQSVQNISQEIRQVLIHWDKHVSSTDQYS